MGRRLEDAQRVQYTDHNPKKQLDKPLIKIEELKESTLNNYKEVSNKIFLSDILAL